jgi:hypothetical protein
MLLSLVKPLMVLFLCVADAALQIVDAGVKHDSAFVCHHIWTNMSLMACGVLRCAQDDSLAC